MNTSRFVSPIRSFSLIVTRKLLDCFLQEHYNTEVLEHLSGKYRGEASVQEYGSAVFAFFVEQFCSFLASEYW